jgi:hypothetical protein
LVVSYTVGGTAQGGYPPAQRLRPFPWCR